MELLRRPHEHRQQLRPLLQSALSQETRHGEEEKEEAVLMRLTHIELDMTLAYAGVIMRDADLDDIAHYFEYIADETAEIYLDTLA